METKHTPGPWYLDGEGVRALVRDASGVIVAVRHRMPGHKNETNMRLIAAAPALLEALQQAFDFPPDFFDRSDDELEQITVSGRHLRMVRAAIAKARGETC